MNKFKSKKTIWIVNFVLLSFVVFLGIQQGGKGAEIAQMEEEIKTLQISKQNYIENTLLAGSSDQVEKKATELGFDKPASVVYIESADVLTSNLIR